MTCFILLIDPIPPTLKHIENPPPFLVPKIKNDGCTSKNRKGLFHISLGPLRVPAPRAIASILPSLITYNSSISTVDAWETAQRASDGGRDRKPWPSSMILATKNGDFHGEVLNCQRVVEQHPTGTVALWLVAGPFYMTVITCNQRFTSESSKLWLVPSILASRTGTQQAFR